MGAQRETRDGQLAKRKESAGDDLPLVDKNGRKSSAAVVKLRDISRGKLAKRVEIEKPLN